MLKGIITGITAVQDVTLITMDNIPNTTDMLTDVFEAIAAQNINIDMISQTSPYRELVNISFTILSNDLSKTLSVIGGFKKSIPNIRTEVNSGNCKLAIYGGGMRTACGVAAKVFATLMGIGVSIRLVTTSETDISILIDESDADQALAALNREFEL